MSQRKEADAKAELGASKELASARDPQEDQKDNPEDQKADKKAQKTQSDQQAKGGAGKQE